MLTVKQQQTPIGGVFMKSFGGELLGRNSLYEGRHAARRSQSQPPKPSDPSVAPVRSRFVGVFSQKEAQQKSIKDRPHQGEWDWIETYTDPKKLVPGNNKTSYKIQWGYQGPDYDNKVRVKEEMKSMLATEAKPQWFPKDILAASIPRTQLYRFDPFYLDHPLPNEIKNTFGCGEAPPREVPQSYARYSSDDAWNDPKNHPTFKITTKPM